MARSRPFWSIDGSLTATPATIYLPPGWRDLKIETSDPAYGALGSAYTPPAVGETNGVLRLLTPGDPTGGVFTLTPFAADEIAVETADIAFDATAATIKSALVATGLFATGDITAGGGALPTAVTLTFTGAYANTIPPIQAAHALTGGSNPRVQLVITTVPDGNGGYGFLNGVEVWTSDRGGNAQDRFLYLASVGASATFQLTAYH